MRKLLIPISCMYWLGVVLRNWFFENGFLKETRIDIPVISVGNISAGGVGKTPIVEMLLERFADKRMVAVISRGYKRKSTGTVVVSDGRGILASVDDAGDEPSQLARKFPQSIVIVDEQRVRGAKTAVECGAKLVILDDGFQHRYLARDLNIAVLSADELKKNLWLLPAGNRREPLGSLQRSDLIVVTRCVDRTDFDAAAQRLLNFGKPVIGMKIQARSFTQIVTGQKNGIGSFANKRAVLFSGIGNPESFERIVKDCGIIIERHVRFPDHHWYRKSELNMIEQICRDVHADCLLITEKDIVRIDAEKTKSLFKNNSAYVVEIEQQILAGKETFERMLNTIDTRI